MEFELTRELVGVVVFAMENQTEDCVFDAAALCAVNKAALNPDETAGDRYYDLPRWTPADGYRLMEEFTVSIKNALIRSKLSAALESGRGVFRKFKDTLCEYPEAEKQWLVYKERIMRRIVYDWYNALRDSWEACAMDAEPEETDDLVGADFSILPARDSDPFELIRNGEFEKKCPDPLPAAFDLLTRAVRELGRKEAEESFIAQTHDALTVGSVTAAAVRGSAGAVFLITNIFVLPEYRGLGLAKKLLERCIESLKERGCAWLLMCLPCASGYFYEYLSRRGFGKICGAYALPLNGESGTYADFCGNLNLS